MYALELNKILIAGRLVAPVEVRYTGTGAAVANIRIASNRSYIQDGDRKQEACFVTIVVWAKQAENAEKYLVKGQLILVEGRLQSRNWEDKNGQKRTSMEVRADRVEYLDKPKGEGGEGDGGEESAGAVASSGGGSSNDSGEEEIPF